MTAERTENKVGREIMRLLKISHETVAESLLDEALAGRTKDVATVSRLFNFVRTWFGVATSPYPNRPEMGSETTRKYEKACREYFEDARVDQKEIGKILGEPNTRGCVLSEFE
jgi:hypothetical protein